MQALTEIFNLEQETMFDAGWLWAFMALSIEEDRKKRIKERKEHFRRAAEGAEALRKRKLCEIEYKVIRP